MGFRLKYSKRNKLVGCALTADRKTTKRVCLPFPEDAP